MLHDFAWFLHDMILHGFAWCCMILLDCAWHVPTKPRSFFHSLSGCRACEVEHPGEAQLRGSGAGAGGVSAEQALRSAEQAL